MFDQATIDYQRQAAISAHSVPLQPGATRRVPSLPQTSAKAGPGLSHMAVGMGGAVASALANSYVLDSGLMKARTSSVLMALTGLGLAYAGWRGDHPHLMWAGAGWASAGIGHTALTFVTARRLAKLRARIAEMEDGESDSFEQTDNEAATEPDEVAAPTVSESSTPANTETRSAAPTAPDEPMGRNGNPSVPRKSPKKTAAAAAAAVEESTHGQQSTRTPTRSRRGRRVSARRVRPPNPAEHGLDGPNPSHRPGPENAVRRAMAARGLARPHDG